MSSSSTSGGCGADLLQQLKIVRPIGVVSNWHCWLTVSLCLSGTQQQGMDHAYISADCISAAVL